MQAASILNKNKEGEQFEKLQQNPGLKKCLSDEYIRHFNRSLEADDRNLKDSDELKKLKKKLDIANNREKSFPSDE